MKKKRMQLQTTPLAQEDSKEINWFLFDAAGKTLGRFASEMTKILRGKHKVDFTPHVDSGDGVIIINAEKIHVTGNKEATKIYRSYSGHVGGMKEKPIRVIRERKPELILTKAIKQMMPRTRLAKGQIRRLRVFKGDQHGMEAQQPITVNI
jgi:large subunit ribosomal protein L13